MSTLIAISPDNFLEYSKFSIRSIFSKISPFTLANLNNKSSSNYFNLILKSFY